MALYKHNGKILQRDGGLATSESCCCGGCGCESLPPVYATLTNVCGSVSFPLVRSTGDGPCSPRYDGAGFMSCRLDEMTECGEPIEIGIIWCVGMPCSITVRCEGLGLEQTHTFELESCDPVYGSLTVLLNLCEKPCYETLIEISE